MKRFLPVILGISLVANLWLVALLTGMSGSVCRAESRAKEAEDSEKKFRHEMALWDCGPNPNATYKQELTGAMMTLSNDFEARLVSQNGSNHLVVPWDQEAPRLLKIGGGFYKIWNENGDLTDGHGDRWKRIW